jgi:hypothetical protein
MAALATQLIAAHQPCIGPNEPVTALVTAMYNVRVSALALMTAMLALDIATGGAIPAAQAAVTAAAAAYEAAQVVYATTTGSGGGNLPVLFDFKYALV